jgi:hypothetical protein
MRATNAAFVSLIGCAALLSGCGDAQEGPPRTVHGAVTTILRSDDGSTTTVPVPINTGDNLWQVTAAWVPTATGYQVFPSTTAADGSFVIPNVPQGLYYLQLDIPAPDNFGAAPPTRLEAAFYPFTADSPDLSSISVGTANAAGGSATVTWSVDGLAPWNPAPVTPGGLADSLVVFGSQTGANFFIATGTSLPAGATSVSKQVAWSPGNLPDASRGDVDFVVQRSASAVGSGATLGSVKVASRFARIADLTLANGESATQAVTLAEAPQTGSLNSRILSSQWTPLVQQSNPTAQPSSQNYSIFGTPGPVGFPDLGPLTINLATVLGPASTDVDYGTITYGQFLGAPWNEVREFTLNANYQFGANTFSLPVYESFDPMPATADVVPVIGPPLAPKVQGLDAFQNQFGVGLTPVISWSPPSLGKPTSYQVGVSQAGGANARYVSLTFTVYGATSLRIPPGFLVTGASYSVGVSSVQAPWDKVGIPPLRFGAPYATAGTMSTASFTP